MVAGYAQSSGLLGTRPITPSSIQCDGEVAANMFVGSVSATSPAIANSGTVASNVAVSRVTPAGAVTGIIITAGAVDGQMLTVVNQGLAASSITFAAAATSNVADGVTTIIAGLRSASFVWMAGTALWYRT